MFPYLRSMESEYFFFFFFSKECTFAWCFQWILQIYITTQTLGNILSFCCILNIILLLLRLISALWAGKNLIDHEQITLFIMGWFSKIFKGSGHNDSDGHLHTCYDEDPDQYSPASSGVINSSLTLFVLLCLQSCTIEMGIQSCMMRWILLLLYKDCFLDGSE